MQNKYKKHKKFNRYLNKVKERSLKSVKKRKLLYQAFPIKRFRKFRRVLILRTVSHGGIR